MKVEVWSDVACPWCYVGARRLESALAGFSHREAVEVVWRSFELDPSAPPERGEDVATHLATKYGRSREEVDAMTANLRAVGAGEGLDLRLDLVRLGSTFDAHRLIHHAGAQGLAAAMKARLLAAYFTEGALVSDHQTLVALATDVGLDGDEVRAILASDAHADAVRTDEAEARRLGISGVPFFVIDRSYGISGAQPAEVLRDALDRAWGDAHPLIDLAAAGDGAQADACGPDGCAIEDAPVTDAPAAVKAADATLP